VSIQGRSTGSIVFFGGKKFLEFGVLLAPIFLACVKGIGKTSPSNIAGQDLLLFGKCLFAIFFKRFQQLYRIDIRLILCFETALTEMIVGNTEVLCVCPYLRFGFLIHGFLCCGSIRKCLPLTADLYGNGMVVQFFIRYIIG